MGGRAWGSGMACFLQDGASFVHFTVLKQEVWKL